MVRYARVAYGAGRESCVCGLRDVRTRIGPRPRKDVVHKATLGRGAQDSQGIRLHVRDFRHMQVVMKSSWCTRTLIVAKRVILLAKDVSQTFVL